MRLLLLLVFASGCATTAHGVVVRGPKTKAAIAIRDHVPDYQKLFTMQFTVPRLRAAYDTYWYFTATADDSKRDEFLAALTEATTQYRVVDVFFLAHGNRYIDWVATLLAEQRAHSPRLRHRPLQSVGARAVPGRIRGRPGDLQPAVHTSAGVEPHQWQES